MKSFRFEIGKLYFGFSLSFVFKKDRVAMGYMNRTKDGFYLPFLDYDRLNLDSIESELNRLAKDYDLPHWIILKSGGKGYHAVCLSKVNANVWTQLLYDSSADWNFKNVPNKQSYRSWVLRINSDGVRPAPKFVKLMKYQAPEKKSIGSGHLKLMFLNGMLPERHYKSLKRFCDGIYQVRLIMYRTGSKVII